MSSPPLIAPIGVNTPFGFQTYTEAGQGVFGQVEASPGNTNAPLIYEPPALFTSGEAQVWILATGSLPSWGGCSVWMSLDGTTYGQLGVITQGCIQGVLTAPYASGPDPDTATCSIDVTESLAQVMSFADIDADKGVSLCLIDSELIAFTTATLTSGFHYDLTTYIRRGLFGTTIASHSTGASFGQFTTTSLVQPYRENLIGTTVYFKFPAFNTGGANAQSLADVSPYTYTLNGNGFEAAVWFQQFSVGSTFSNFPTDSWDGNYEIFDVQMPTAVTFPANMISSPTPGCEVAPLSNVTLTLQHIVSGTPTTIGTITIAASSTTGSFSTSGATINAGDRLRLYAPAGVDTTISGIFGTLVGQR